MCIKFPMIKLIQIETLRECCQRYVSVCPQWSIRQTHTQTVCVICIWIVVVLYDAIYFNFYRIETN